MTAYLTMPMTDQRLSHVWKTTIQIDIEGGEKRSAIQTWPRVTLENKIQLTTDAERGYMSAVMFREIYGFWQVPVISDRALLTGSAAAGQKILAIDETSYRHFYDGRQLVLIDPTDWESYEVATIDTVDSDTQITVTVNLVGTWGTDTLVFPLYKCRITEEQTTGTAFYDIDTVKIIADEEFESLRTYTYTLPTINATVFPTYDSLPLFLHRPRNPVSLDVRKPYNILGDIGFKTPFSTYDDARSKFSREYQFTTKAEVYNHLDFFDAQQGRYGSFYMPTWYNDLRLSVAALATDTTLTVSTVYLTSGEIVGRHIYIGFLDGTYACREITGLPSATSITIGSQIGTAVTTAEISFTKISFLPEVRFDQDEIALDYQSKKKEIARVRLAFNSL